MATTSTMQLSPSPPIPSPLPASPYPAFPRIPSSSASSSTPSITRNASTCSSASTSSTTSSLVAAPIRPPPIETRTAATTPAQVPSRPGSADPFSQSSLRNQVPIGLRAPIRNGPRSRAALPTHSTPLNPSSPLGQGDRVTPERPTASIGPDSSPTTPRAPRWLPQDSLAKSSEPAPRVTISMDLDQTDNDQPLMAPRPIRGRESGQRSTPSSPIDRRSPRLKHRTLSVDGRAPVSGDEQRERRISQASVGSSASTGARKPSLKDFVLGEELGRGSYSTVVQATSVLNVQSPTSSKPPREYAIKIINQAHLVAEKKVKYAIIERDALIRLAQPSSAGRGHRRGLSSSSSTGTATVNAPRRRSNASVNTSGANQRDQSSSTSSNRDRLSVVTNGTSPITYNAPVSPTLTSSMAGRRPSRSAEPPAMVSEVSEDQALESPIENLRSRPPSPVREESAEETQHPNTGGSPVITTAPPTPHADARRNDHRSRRQSLASSERSGKSGKSAAYAHPGVIRLHSTFNDQASLYFVLDLAKNGEMLGFIRKHGSLDLASARYYAAQLLDTIEFMHERDVIHRDLKPENILLDENMRIKITDFGSAKIVGRDAESQGEGQKRSFVGSADFVSPEVLRSEPAVFASDVWAFGCILFHLLSGRPPFRAATDYLTFQHILKRQFDWPEGIDLDAKDLIDIVLNVDPTSRPTVSDIKNHAFFTTINWFSLWHETVPAITTGLNRPTPISTSAPTESDLWAVFDDEVSDGGFEYDDEPADPNIAHQDHSVEPQFDRRAAADAVQLVDNPHARQGSSGSLEPPRPAFVEGQRRKGRKWSDGSKSARTSSSSSNNRTALTGLLETMGIHTSANPSGASASTSFANSNSPNRSTRAGRSSQKTDEAKTPSRSHIGIERWSSLLLANERIVYYSLVAVRSPPTSGSTLIPSFLLPAAKSRFLLLTDFPRLVEVKDTAEEGPGLGPRIKFEAVFLEQPNVTVAPTASTSEPKAGMANRVLAVQDKGNKGFVVTVAGNSVMYTAETATDRAEWMKALQGISPA